jgi:hypothetical protein
MAASLDAHEVARTAVLSVITGGGKWVEIKTQADPLYQHLIVTAERKFWRCVESGEPPALFGVDPPKPRIEAVRIVDMSTSNAWAEFAGVFIRTREAHLEHEKAKAELRSRLSAAPFHDSRNPGRSGRCGETSTSLQIALLDDLIRADPLGCCGARAAAEARIPNHWATIGSC